MKPKSDKGKKSNHKHSDTPAQHLCPTCGNPHNAAASVRWRAKIKKRKLKPGDVSVCGDCGEILVFNQHGIAELADLDVMMALDPETRHTLGKAQRLIRRSIRAKQKSHLFTP